jgi:hypothetical protein
VAGLGGCMMVQLGNGVGSGPCLAGRALWVRPRLGRGWAGMLAAGRVDRLWGLWRARGGCGGAGTLAGQLGREDLRLGGRCAGLAPAGSYILTDLAGYGGR